MKLIFIITLQDKELEGKTASVRLAVANRVHCEQHGTSPGSLSPRPAALALPPSLANGVFLGLLLRTPGSPEGRRAPALLVPHCRPVPSCQPLLAVRGLGLRREWWGLHSWEPVPHPDPPGFQGSSPRFFHRGVTGAGKPTVAARSLSLKQARRTRPSPPRPRRRRAPAPTGLCAPVTGTGTGRPWPWVMRTAGHTMLTPRLTCGTSNNNPNG